MRELNSAEELFSADLYGRMALTYLDLPYDAPIPSALFAYERGGAAAPLRVGGEVNILA